MTFKKSKLLTNNKLIIGQMSYFDLEDFDKSDINFLISNSINIFSRTSLVGT